MNEFSKGEKIALAYVVIIVTAHSIGAIKTVVRERERRRKIEALRKSYANQFDIATREGYSMTRLGEIMAEFNRKLEKI